MIKNRKIVVLICLALFFVIYLTGCLGTKKNTPPPDPNKVYIAGFCTHHGTSQTACYWENMTRHDLHDGYEATSIMMVGNNLYIAGYYREIVNYAPVDIACYWVNGTRMPLNNTQNTTSQAKAIFVDGTDVYVAGKIWDQAIYRYVACYWKNGVITKLSQDYSSINGIYVKNGNVYLVGYDGYDACYWLNDQKQVLDGGTKATSIDINDTGIYIAGEFKSGPPWGGYWLDGVKVPIPDGYKPTAIKVSGPNVYIAGTYLNSFEGAAYWINQSKTEVFLAAELNSLFVAGTDVYVCGIQAGYTNPAYWKNNEMYPLPHDNVTGSTANSIFVICD